MKRFELIQLIVDKAGAQKYLEIGISRGECFNKINCNEKFGCDISKQIDGNIYEGYSNSFFEQKDLPIFDIIFIDGDHSFKQSLLDAINSYNNIKLGGTIVLHDCNPLNEEKTRMCWNGEVWKTIFYLREIGANIYVVDMDEGCGVLVKDNINIYLNIDIFNKIAKYNYQYMDTNRSYLRLISIDNFIDLLNKENK